MDFSWHSCLQATWHAREQDGCWMVSDPGMAILLMLSCKLPSNLLYGNREVGWSSISVVSHASVIHDVVFHPTDLDYLVQDLRMIGHFWPGLRENAFRSLLRFKTKQSPWRSKMILGCLRPCATRDLRHSHWHCINRMDATLNDMLVFWMRTCTHTQL